MITAPPGSNEVLPQSYFKDIDYKENVIQWDLCGEPQPAVRLAALQGMFGSIGSSAGKRKTTILDCGCGAGDNAIFLASLGFDCLGFDLNPTAVEVARERSAANEASAAAKAAGGATEFIQASATDLGAAARVQERARELGGGFEVALDSALLHCLDDDAQRTYVEGLRALAKPGASLFVGCFSDGNPDPWTNPRRMSEAELRALIAPQRGWRLVSLRQVWYQRPDKTRRVPRQSGGKWTMAWWCHAEACAKEQVVEGVQEADLRPPSAVEYRLPRWFYRTTLPALGGGVELTLVVARSDGDPQVEELPWWLTLTKRWRLIVGWRATGSGSPKEGPGQRAAGTCFGFGGESIWGEDFFMLDADC